MKRHELIFSLLKLPFDFLIVFLAFFIAKYIRTINESFFWIELLKHYISNNDLIIFSFTFSLILISIFSIHWLYNIKISSSKIKEIFDIIIYSFYSFLFFSVFVYFSQWFIFDTQIPRLIIIYAFFITVILIILERFILNKIQQFLLKNWIIEKRNLIIINNKKDSEIKNILNDIKNAIIYNLLWYVNKIDIQSKNISYLWGKNEINDIFKNKNIDEILFIWSDFSKKELQEIWELSRIFGIRYRYITNLFDVKKTNTELTLINKIPVLEIKTTPLDWFRRIIKRIIDFFLSLIWIIILLPIFIIIWILIKLEDPSWPIIYKNLRVWQKQKKFFLYKFRYMKWKYCIKDSYWIKNEDDEAFKYEQELIKKRSTRTWPLYKIKDDPRKTRIWNFIEKYSIDELPQLFNVLIWNMSLVWPRPHQPREVEKYKLHHKRVLTIKPWITWLAQVNWREKNKFEDEINLDLFYIENRTLLLDIKIILKTFPKIFKR